MGWSSLPYRKATHTSLTEDEALRFIRNENSAFEFSMFHFHKGIGQGNYHECYMLMRHHQNMKNFICCTIIEITNGEIYWKDIEESMHPAYTNCPKYFFKFLKAPNDLAEAWRKECSLKDIKFKPIHEYS